MKINNRGLERLYRSYIRQKVPLSRENCPPIKDIIECFKPRFSNRKKTRILDHITNCAHCSLEFDFILQSLREEEILLREIDILMKTQDHAKISPEKSFFYRLTWGLVPLFIGAIIVVFGLVMIINNDLFIRKEKREFGGTNNKIKLLEPIGQKRASHPMLFRWNEASISDWYILEIYDEALSLFWKSPKLFSARFALPAEAFNRLNKKKNYYWIIVSFRNGEKYDESPLQGFFLKE